jgi:hypothetical protein
MGQIMSYRPHGKHVIIDEQSPFGLGICDYTGFVFNRKDLIKQMRWSGNAIVCTGFLVGRPYADIPNEQDRPPILPPDPVPLRDPRTQQAQINVWNTLGQQTWNNLYTPLNFIATDEDGVEALPANQRLAPLQNYYWGN